MKIFLFLLFIGFNSQTSSVKVLEKENFQVLMEQESQVIDVRTPEEYAKLVVSIIDNVMIRPQIFKLLFLH